MARITTVAKARKAQGNCFICRKPIEAGDSYKWFANLIGRTSIKKKACSDCQIRPSHMTTSDKLSRIYEAGESIDDVRDTDTEHGLLDVEAIASTVTDAASSVREVGEEYRESADNIESGFGNRTYQCDELEEKADACESWADTADDVVNDLEGLEVPERCETCEGAGTLTHDDGVEEDCDECDEPFEAMVENFNIEVMGLLDTISDGPEV